MISAEKNSQPYNGAGNFFVCANIRDNEGKTSEFGDLVIVEAEELVSGRGFNDPSKLERDLECKWCLLDRKGYVSSLNSKAGQYPHLSLPRLPARKPKRPYKATPKATPPTSNTETDNDSEFSEFLSELQIPIFLTASSEDTIHPLDSRYFHFFLTAMPHILSYANLFPNIIVDIFSRSIPHKSLRHSVLSVSSWMADHRLSRPLDRFQLQYINAIQMIQKSIQTMDLDEGTAIAVFLVLWIDAVRADLRAVRKHLRGFHLILQELQSRGGGLSPLILDIWRIAFRLDWTANLYLGEEPILPSISTTQEDTYLQWLEISVIGEGKSEWAIATFAIDDLLNQACRTAVQARQIRRSEGYTSSHEAIIQCKVAKLEDDIMKWRQTSLIQSAELLEQTIQGTSSPTSNTEGAFLGYEPLTIFNPFYVNLLNASRSILIYTSLIASPNMGFSEVPERFPLAVNICRTLAALENDKTLPLSSRVWMHYLAGVAFGGSRNAPREVEWLSERMEYIGKVFPLTKSNVVAAMRWWEVGGNFWDTLEGDGE